MAYTQRRMVYNPTPTQEEPKEEPEQRQEEVGVVAPRRVHKECEVLNDYLTKLWSLKTSSKAKHWVTTGQNFLSIHELYDQIHDWTEESIDEIAENLTGNDISFTISTGEISSIDNIDDGSTWRGLLKEEFECLEKTKHCLARSVDKADDYDLIGLQNILEDQMTKLDKIIYFVKQTIS